ncbi:uncharacterized protein BXZ73DRAFT_108090 [Epithele typhae]|uniref:uncharacterized protein n=1 Tax=Epithele typhae TaxID=378194 RepID=UPI0020082A95|nr:uncharacterized protein BXZ73DRAFT_108090 [Epithele typhae]KAH9911325.1 hypothetical protein BXZ73DRAFT_108090 [Epithele typhae]
MLPIERCPVEVFTEIIHYLVHFESPAKRLCLLLVSKAWRDAILNTKSFWSTIHLRGDNGEKQWLQLSLDKAHGASLHIHINFDHIPHLDFTTFLHHASNIQSLTLTYLFRWHLHALNTFLSSDTFPSLKKLSVEGAEDACWKQVSREAAPVKRLVLNRTNIPSLETLHLTELNHLADPSFFEHLRVLSLSRPGMVDSFTDFMNTLRAMTHLRSLEFGSLHVSPDALSWDHPSPVTLPSLTHFKICDSTPFELTTLFSYLFIPRATNVDIHYLASVDAHGRQDVGGHPTRIADILPSLRGTNVLPMLSSLTDIALVFQEFRCQIWGSSPGHQHSINVSYEVKTPPETAAARVRDFVVRDLADIVRDCPAVTHIEVSPAFTLTTHQWRTLLGQLPRLKELCFEGCGPLVPLWTALDPGRRSAADEDVLCPALRAVALRDCTPTRSPWEHEALRRKGIIVTPPAPRIELCVDALSNMLRARAERGVSVAKLAYVAAPRMRELEEFRTVWRGEHTAALAEHVADVEIKTMYKEIEGDEAEATWRGGYTQRCHRSTTS